MDTLTSVIEIGVGAGCLVGGAAALRAARTRILGFALVVAGSLATVHAAVSLARR